jgi:hypothetical protein
LARRDVVPVKSEIPINALGIVKIETSSYALDIVKKS